VEEQKKKEKKVTIRMPKHLHKLIRVLSFHSEISMNRIIVEALENVNWEEKITETIDKIADQ